jgi:hypothetical protein
VRDGDGFLRSVVARVTFSVTYRWIVPRPELGCPDSERQELEMKQKLSETKHSMNMMWGCVAIVVVAFGISLAVGSARYLLFVVPCMLMMGAMMWMMMGGSGGSSSRGERK